MDKIHMVQEVVLAVQNVLEEIANIGERVKKYFNRSVFLLELWIHYQFILNATFWEHRIDLIFFPQHIQLVRPILIGVDLLGAVRLNGTIIFYPTAIYCAGMG